MEGREKSKKNDPNPASLPSLSTLGFGEQKRKSEVVRGANNKERRRVVQVEEQVSRWGPVLRGGTATENSTEAEVHSRLAAGPRAIRFCLCVSAFSSEH